MNSRISWEIEVPSRIGGNESIILRRDVVKEQVQSAANLCVDGLTRHFSLSPEARCGIEDTFQESSAKLVSGNEGDFDEDTVLPIGPVASNVIDLHSRNTIPVSNRAEKGKKDIRISIEGVAQEAENLREASLRYAKELGQNSGISERAAERVTALIEDHEVLAGAAVRVAAARRLLKYVLLPDGILKGDKARSIGFDEWFEDLQNRRSEIKSTAKERAMARKIYKSPEHNMGLRTLRRTAWAPLFFQNIGIEQSELIFHLLYREILSQNDDYTVTFSDPHHLMLDPATTKATLEEIFVPKQTRPRLVK